MCVAKYLLSVTIYSLVFIGVAGSKLSAAPNVIVIMTDDLGFGDIYNLHQYKRDNGAGGGIAGDGIINGSEEAFIYTPNIDRMAAEGAKLTRHYTSAPVCAPARGSLLQGRDQGHANVRNNSFDKVISDNHTLGTVMKEAGYYTACIGKWGVGGGGAGRPNVRGFDYFYGYLKHGDGHQHYPGNGGTVLEQASSVTTGLDHAYTTDLWTARTKQVIQDRVANAPTIPFFIYLAYDAPHAQLQVPTQAYPTGSGTSGGLSWPLNTNSGTNDSYIHPSYSGLANNAARHATMVRRIDDCMGDLLQTLRDLDIDDNTLVVFTSDNGTHNESGSGGSVAHNPRLFDSYGELEGIKRDQWEGGIRMPTFAWWPTKIGDDNAATPGLNSIRPSAFWDWMPTIVDAAGLTPPAWSSGVSLLPELTGAGGQLDRGYLYFEYQNSGSTPTYADFPVHGGSTRGEMQAIFMDGDDGKRYKGIRYDVSDHTKDFLIYDVDADPGETTNLAINQVALQQEMKDKVLQVRVDGDYPRAYMTDEYAAPATTTNVSSGLDFKAYEGNWGWVPETAYLTEVASGVSSNLDLSQRTRDDDCLLEFEGYILLPSDGTYTFEMTTDSGVSTNDSGGMLWIHDAHIIDDDFSHDGTSESGFMRLKAGRHPIRVLYKHSSGAHDINLKYSGPGIALQDVTDSMLFRDETAAVDILAVDDSVSTTSTKKVSIPVLINDIDDGLPNALSILSVTSPGFGSAVINGESIDYVAEAGKYGWDQFEYTITDGVNTSTATVMVNVLVASEVSGVVLHTDFTGFTTAGTTISSFTWSSDIGEAENASVDLLLSGSASGFNNTTAGTGGSGPAVGVAGNIETNAPWETSFIFTPSQSIAISSFEISSYAVNNSGVHQGGSQSVDWALEISSGGVDFTGNVTAVEPGGDGQQLFNIDTSRVILMAATSYTFKLTVSSTETAGNNIAFDSLTLIGTPNDGSDVLHTDFTGFSTAGTTISGFTWSSDIGEGANASNSLLLTGSASGFNTTVSGAGGSGPAVGVAGNIETNAPWSTSFTFTPSQSIRTSSFEVSSYSVNNNGGHQGVDHSVNWKLVISSGSEDFSGDVTEVEAGGSARQLFVIDTAGTTLNSGTTYTFALTVSRAQNGGGNNVALDALTLKRSVGPETESDLWYFNHFGDGTPSLTMWQSDSDGDGVSELGEYAFGGNPHVSDGERSTPLAAYDGERDKFNVTYNRRVAGTHDLTYLVQVTEGFDSWLLPYVELGAIPHPTLGSEFEAVTVETVHTTTQKVKQFVRVKADFDDE